MNSLRKRTLSRGMSEDESIRHIIREAEETSRFLSRNDSRSEALKRQKEETLDEKEFHTEMVELQANYQVCLQEVRALELQQEALLFQVDCLQDALEGAEEMLSETQREAHSVTVDLEREREARRKLEDMVASLMQEMKVLREGRNSVSIIPVNELIGDQAQAVPNGSQDMFSGTSVDGAISQEEMSTVHLVNVLQCPAPTEDLVLTSTAAVGSQHAEPIWLQGAPEGTSVDQDETALSEASQMYPIRSSVIHLEKMVNHSFCQSVHLNQRCEAADKDDNDESSGYEDAPSEISPSPSTPDVQPDVGLLEGEFCEAYNESTNPKNAESCALS